MAQHHEAVPVAHGLEQLAGLGGEALEVGDGHAE
jgi:hypothetical protein